MYLKAAERVLRCLKGTVELGLCYTKGGEESLPCFADASYGGDEGYRRSTSGCVVTTMGAAVHWVSQIQKKTLNVGQHRTLVSYCTFYSRWMWSSINQPLCLKIIWEPSTAQRATRYVSARDA